MKKAKIIYRGLEYHKYRLAIMFGIIIVVCVMCTPSGNDVPYNNSEPDTLVPDSITLKSDSTLTTSEEK